LKANKASHLPMHCRTKAKVCIWYFNC